MGLRDKMAYCCNLAFSSWSDIQQHKSQMHSEECCSPTKTTEEEAEGEGMETKAADEEAAAEAADEEAAAEEEGLDDLSDPQGTSNVLSQKKKLNL